MTRIREIAAHVGQVDDEERRVVEVPVVLVRVASTNRRDERRVDVARRRRRVGLRRDLGELHLDAHRVAVGLRAPVAALVGLGAVAVIERALPRRRGEAVIGAGAREQLDLTRRLARAVGRGERGIRRARVLRCGLAEAGADEPLRSVDGRRIVLVRVDPRGRAGVTREVAARLEGLLRRGLVLGRAEARLIVDLGDRALGLRRRGIHRPPREHRLVDLERVGELIQAAILERERAVDLDRPRLVLRNERRVLHPVDRDVELLLRAGGARLAVEDVRASDERLPVLRPLEVGVGERARDVRVRLATEVRAMIAGDLLALVGEDEELHQLLRRELVALLLEERPRVFVERNAVNLRLPVGQRVRVGAGSAVVAPHRSRVSLRHAAREVELIELPVSDLPPHLGEVARLFARLERRLCDGHAIGRIDLDVDGLRILLRDGARAVVAASPFRPVRLVGVLRHWPGRGVVVVVVADERPPGLLRLGHAARIAQRVPEEVVNARELAVGRVLAEDPLVEADGVVEPGVLGARTLLVERGQTVHRVGCNGGGARSSMALDEGLEPRDGDRARALQLRRLGGELVVEPREDRLLLRLVVQLDDARDGVAIVPGALLVGADLLVEQRERRDLRRRRWRSWRGWRSWRRSRRRRGRSTSSSRRALCEPAEQVARFVACHVAGQEDRTALRGLLRVRKADRPRRDALRRTKRNGERLVGAARCDRETTGRDRRSRILRRNRGHPELTADGGTDAAGIERPRRDLDDDHGNRRRRNATRCRQPQNGGRSCAEEEALVHEGECPHGALPFNDAPCSRPRPAADSVR